MGASSASGSSRAARAPPPELRRDPDSGACARLPRRRGPGPRDGLPADGLHAARDLAAAAWCHHRWSYVIGLSHWLERTTKPGATLDPLFSVQRGLRSYDSSHAQDHSPTCPTSPAPPLSSLSYLHTHPPTRNKILTCNRRMEQSAGSIHPAP